MAWFKKKKPPTPVKPSRAAIIAEAKANMRAARERIGDDEIQKMAKALFHKDEGGAKH